MELEERAAIKALQRGDIRGLESLFRQYQLAAARTAFLVTGDRQLAEDVVMDAFLSVYEHINQFDDRRSFSPWFYRIVVNTARMALRTSRRTVSTDDRIHPGLSQQVSPLMSPADVVERQEQQRLVAALLGMLSPDQRATVVLRYYLDMDETAIAKTLGCARGTVKWRLHDARRRMRRTLSEGLAFATPV